MRQCGFTLLEVLIAIAIFALLGMATYRMLDSVLRSDSGLREQEQRLRELTRAMATFERDLLQVRARPVRDPLGEPLASLRGDSELEFTRSGWRNPLGQPRATLQRVRWRVEGERWQRAYWPVLDQAQDSQPRVQQVLDGVTRFELRFLDLDGRWLQSWPPAGRQPDEALTGLPKAIELIIEHRHYGELRRIWRMPQEPQPGRTIPPGGAPETPVTAVDGEAAT